VPSVLSPEEAAHVKGVTGAIWTEYVRTPARLEFTLLPRMLALSEIAWTPVARKDFARFAERQLPRQLARLDAAGYEYRVPVAIGPVDTMMQGNRFRVTLQPPVEGARIYWTIDGYPASETDELYTAPFSFDIPEGQQRELQAVVVTPTNRKSRVTRTVMYNRPQPENNPFGVVHALEYRLFKGPIADLATMDRSTLLASDTASGFDPSRLRARGASFGVVYFGQVALDLDGTYTFELASTGASRLYIDDRLVVDNPGEATETVRSGQITGLRGLRRIRVLYAEDRPGSLAVSVTAPRRAKVPVQGDMLRGSVFGRGQTGIDAQ
jgi:hexosaminidase